MAKVCHRCYGTKYIKGFGLLTEICPACSGKGFINDVIEEPVVIAETTAEIAKKRLGWPKGKPRGKRVVKIQENTQIA